jgi:hypothetical protein
MNDNREFRCSSDPAQALAGKAVLLEIGAKVGILDPLLSQKSDVSVTDVARAADVDEGFVAAYYAALAHAGIVQRSSANLDGPARYSAAPDLPKTINDVGYILWGVVSCAPLIANARAFAKNMPAAIDACPRDGEHVARTSKWMGETDFYPHAESAIVAARPAKLIDLGSGTCGLLIRCLRKLPGARGVGIDINADACAKARTIVKGAGLAERLTVLHAPIQSLVEDPSPLEGAGVIHGGFVFHDLMPDEEAVLDALLRTFRTRAPESTLVIVDAVPYAAESRERAFSATFTFLHSHFMGRQLQPEETWKHKLATAGYRSIDVKPLGIGGGRIFTARPA